MNYWTGLSIEYANQRSYLDDLKKLYEIEIGKRRVIDDNVWNKIVHDFKNHNDFELINELLKLELFPYKEPFAAFLRIDPSAINRNPKTFNRICEILYEMGLDDIKKGSTMPKEMNRRMGHLFKNWVNKGSLGVKPVELDEFIKTKSNCILKGTDAKLKDFAKDNLGYEIDRGLDFVGKFNGKYVLGEAKFISNDGGNQDKNIAQALALLDDNADAVKVAILDGVTYIKRDHRHHNNLYSNDDHNIMSALVLNEFLYQI